MSARLRRPAVALITTTLAASVLAIAPAASAVDGTLSGTVTGPGGALLGDVRVELYQFDTEDGRWRDTGDFTDTGSDGAYTFSVPEGEYAVGFDDYTDTYAAEFYNDADVVEDADPVTVPGAPLATALVPAAHVTGTVLYPNGDPLTFATVVAYRPVVVDGETEYRQVGFDHTAGFFNPDALPGSYDIGGLPGGDYLIEFEAYAPQGMHAYAIEYYDNAPNRYVADGGTPDVPIDAQLELDSEISGVVYDTTSSTPADNGTAVVYAKVDDAYLEIEEVDVQSDGSYVIDGLSADTYYVRFRADVAGGRAQEYWDDQPSVLTATGIELGVGETEGAISPVLAFGQNQSPSLQPVTDPTISGTPQVGSTLTASPGTWSPSPTSIRYAWFAGGEIRQDTSSNTYVPVVADIGREISVDVYVTATGYDTSRGSAVASGVVVPAPTPPVVTTPVVVPPVVTPPVFTPPVVDVAAGLAAVLKGVDTSGKPKVGRTIKVTGLEAMFRASTAVSYKFQWYAGTKKIKKATKSKLKVTKAMKGKKLAVKVTATAASTSRSVKLKVGKVS
jgi:hypothetical protein